MTQPTGERHPGSEVLNLYALNDHEVSLADADHITHCSACGDQVARLRSFEEYLKDQLYRSDCPSSEMISAYAWGELSAAEDEVIQAHISGCKRCAEDLVASQAFLSEVGRQERFTIAQEPAYQVPVDDQAPAPSFGEQLLRIVAMRIADPEGEFALNLKGAENEDEDATAQVYLADDFIVTLRTEEVSPGRYLLYGKIGRASDEDTPGGAHVALVRLDEATTSDARDIVAETQSAVEQPFELLDIPRGRYRLDIQVADRLVEIPDLTF